MDLADTYTPTCMLTNTMIYLFCICNLHQYMVYRPAYTLKHLMQVYNVMQILLNAYMIGGFAYTTYPNIIAYNIPYSDNLEYYMYVHYLSKYFDYFDTIFIILKKNDRQLSFLHIFHHSSVPIIWGLLLHVGHANGSASVYCILNSIVHLLMYSHYFITSLGYHNPYKTMVTRAQLIQFITFITYSTGSLFWEIIYPMEVSYIGIGYSIFMVFLFSNFYIKNYLKQKNNIKS